jgi:ferredoxin
MPNITFCNPGYKDKTVYATAGSHTDTVLKIAREHKIPIEFSCADGECGTCLIRVKPLGGKTAMGGPLTDKEIVVLRQLKRITPQQIEEMAVTDLPTEWRLACQMIVRDEDLLVEY